MSVKHVCSLCCTACIEFKSLRTCSGQYSEIYNITAKYFDPMLLTQDESTNSHHNPILCRDCWFNIHEFYEFQQKVLKTRMSFENRSNLTTFLVEVKQEAFIQANVPTSKRSDNASLVKTQDDEDNPFENNLECRDLKTESLTSCLNTLASILEQEVIQTDVPTSNTSNNGSFEKSKDDEDNLFEYNLEYGDLKPESPTRCNANIESILKQTGDKDENSLALEEYMNNDEHNLTTAKRKIRQRTRNINKDVKSKLTEDKEIAAKTNFNMERIVESDAIIAKWQSELICDLCSETVTNFDKMRSHFKEKHKTKSYIKCCERKFYYRPELAEHIQLHLNPDTFKCDICGKFCTSKRNLRLHKKVVHENKRQLKCGICEKIFKQKINLKQHLLIHSTSSKDFICSECGKCYLTEQILNHHIKHVHNVDCVCDQCGKTVPRQALKSHLMEHAGIERPNFPCDVCGIKLQSPYSLKRHKIVYHSNDSTIYVCGVCGKVLASEFSLLSHKRIVHATERKHRCTYCDKRFTLPRYLRQHIATHTDEYLYQCPYCAQKFKASSNMYQHRKKFHPVEWEEARKSRPQCRRTNNNEVKKHIAIY